MAAAQAAALIEGSRVALQQQRAHGARTYTRTHLLLGC
jgi:hypothetical protein